MYVRRLELETIELPNGEILEAADNLETWIANTATRLNVIVRLADGRWAIAQCRVDKPAGERLTDAMLYGFTLMGFDNTPFTFETYEQARTVWALLVCDYTTDSEAQTAALKLQPKGATQ